MDSSRKRRGLKGKLMMSFHRSPTPASMQYSSKVKPTVSPSTAVILEDEFVMPTPIQKPSSLKRESGGYVVNSPGEESVDKRAANYISHVQERFRLEQIESDTRKY